MAIGHPDMYHHRRIHLFPPSDSECSFRQHLCTLATLAGSGDRISDDDTHCHDDCCFIEMVGIVLAISLLTIPQMTANLFTYNYKQMIFASIILGWIDCIIGLYASYVLNVPSGATIILSVSWFLCSVRQ